MAALHKNMSRKIGPAPLLWLLLVLKASIVPGQDDPADALVREKLAAIQQMLKEGKKGADIWWYGWLAGYSAATVAQLSVMAGSPHLDTRQDMALGAATTFLGAMGQVISPMTPGIAPGRLAMMPELTPEERMLKLGEAEKWLEESARRERSGRSWKTHALCCLVNGGSGLVTWFGFDRDLGAGIGNFLLNTAITETQIFTQPVRAKKDYDRYMEKYYGGGNREPWKSHALIWSLQASPGGVSFRLVF